MPRVLAVLALVVCASPVCAQSVYVGAAAGMDATLASRFEVTGQPQGERGGSTPAVAGRAGVVLGNRWGAEVEVSYSMTLERTVEGVGAGVSPPIIGVVPPIVVFPTVTIESEQRFATVNALAWVSYAVTARTELVLLAGVAFNRAEVEERRQFELPPRIVPGVAIGIGPQATTVVVYDAGPIVGVEGRIALGDRFRLVPGVRLAGVSAGWSIRPTAGVAWVF